MRRLLLIPLLMLISLSSTVLAPLQVSAANASDWQAGNIIDDPVFTDTTSMSVSDIQTWLDARLANCDYYGTQPANRSGGIDYNNDGVITRAEYGKYKGNPAPFTCLNMYYEVPKTAPGAGTPASNYGKSTKPTGSKSAAQLIYDAAQAYNISPKVLLVKLGTESGGPLTSDVWPYKVQYTYAMGAHCPDSGPGGSANCDSNYAGFSLQMREAAKLLRWYLDNMTADWWAYKKPYATNSILWNVQPSGCGAGNVYIENKATAALYTYTPYQPNAAALNNLYGNGDRCSAYGNRNFWRVYVDWFGNPHLYYTNLDDPRWMQLKTDLYKTNLATGETTGAELLAGRQIYFPDKVKIKGAWYLRTQYDQTNGNPYGIRLVDLEEIPVEQITPIWKSIPNETIKIDPVRSASYETVSSQIAVKIVDQMVLDGKIYYRTEWESAKDRPKFLPADELDDFMFYAMMEPRILYARNTLNKLDLTTGTVVESIPAGSYLTFDKRISVNGILYVQAKIDSGSSRAVRFDQLSEFDGRVQYIPLTKPRTMKLTTNTHKMIIPGLQETGDPLLRGREIYFPEKVSLDNVWYLRTQYDMNKRYSYGIPLDELAEL